MSDHYYVNKMVERWVLLLNGGAQGQALSFFLALYYLWDSPRINISQTLTDDLEIRLLFFYILLLSYLFPLPKVM